MAWDQDAEREFWRRKCLDSFWFFFCYCYGYWTNPRGGGGTSPWLDEHTHRPLCDWYERHVKEWLADRKAGRGKLKKLMIVVPRDFGKTTLLAQAGQAWLHLHDKELATYTGCETATRAKEILSGIKSVIGGEDRYARYTWLYGNERHPKRSWKLDSVVTASRTNLTRRDASYGVWAVESGLVGMHPDVCFLDDPNTYERMESNKDWLDVVNRHIDTLVPVFQRDSLWVFTLTRYGDGDHAGKNVEHEGVVTCEGMPMPGLKLDPNGLWHVFFMDAVDDNEIPIMPKIWPKERIESFMRRNPERYWAQVRNNPTQTPYNVLTRSQADRMVVGPKEIDLKKLRVSLHFDTAFNSPMRKQRGDYSVISAVGHEPKTGVCVFLGARASRDWTIKEFDTELVASINEWRAKCARVMCMTDEEDIGGKPGIWEAHVHTALVSGGIKQIPKLILIKRDNRRKAERLAQAAGLWRDGKMKILKDSLGSEVLLDQMSKIGKSSHDDIADATSECFNKQVYTAVWSGGAETEGKMSANPFDDVLKPGPNQAEACERVAKMWDEREQMANMWPDVICP